MRRFLDRMIRIDERQTKSLRQPLADRGLARAHQADEHKVPPLKALDQSKRIHWQRLA
jgi:hypothetical protein